MYGDQPLEMFKEYSYPVTGEKLNFTRISFYISNITLKSTNGDIILKDIDYLNLTAAHTDPVTGNGFEYLLRDIPAGNYHSLDFGIGVPVSSNAMEPKDFSSGHILSNSAEYWSAWKSYIFFRPEGKIALNMETTPNTNFALHLGGDDAFRSISLHKSISVSENAVSNFDIIIDMNNYFNGQTLFDIRNTLQIHSLNQKPLITILADNLVTGIR
ncbi:MAG: hypothetical protein H7X99_08145 [Saprospiraceae bacterium]|nr:hypothetical protein [Saprospiraceae bacterium]